MQLGNGVSGTLMFKGKVSNASGGDKTNIHFGGSATDITVNKKKDNPQTDTHDISVKKTATLSSDRRYVDYTVTASTTKGTEGTVTIGDHLDKNNSSNANPSYDTSSLSVKRVDANGSTSSVSYSSDQVTWDTSASDGPHFNISGLPQLNAGEKYVVTYRGGTSTPPRGHRRQRSRTARMQNLATTAVPTGRAWVGRRTSRSLAPTIRTGTSSGPSGLTLTGRTSPIGWSRTT
jgi:hypothetical protein